ncbi:NTF2-like N-terminal transpeptidase domain-containing protein [Amycolatopsis xylanica]|uniref:NTF2-like N-terminal transpeptidase domain-containing protein n=1 Tax=Amycolatopsis xylanica TaxID=589385 RepID=A0A1H3GBD0_9PSEU|nr:penicillin-binding transpeptidase domain-containing protein [Amycolatopsis xylanica]SDX99639.1 NTF2-like N-terminal transpeptidase domain-containing protein [Amycolatopsis xylanica]
MSTARRRGILIGAAVAVVVVVLAGVVLLNSGSTPDSASGEPGPATTAPGPKDMATKYVLAFSSHDAASAGKYTDNPQVATAAISDVYSSVSAKVRATLTEVAPAAAGATTSTGKFHLVWSLTSEKWDYDVPIELVRSGNDWKVHWTPALLHPELKDGQRLLLKTAGKQPAVVDRDGKALVGGDVTTPLVPLLDSALNSAKAQSSGDAGFAIGIVDGAGAVVKEVFTKEGSGTVKPATSTVSLATQAAAQAAVDSAGDRPAVIISMKANGEITSAARNAAAAAKSTNPFSGQFAPGSAFKIATATAALESGIDANEARDCPEVAQIGQRTLKNDGFGYPNPIPLHQAFAKSCNTTFGQIAADLPADGLKKAADQFGLNADFSIPGLTTEAGKVEAADDKSQRVEDGIGQGRVTVSPFGACLMAATVASGKAVTPQLFTDLPTEVGTGYKAPPAGVLGPLRQMMREVVTGGTATDLAKSGEVRGKTGTAQFGSGENAHGWFVGYKGDTAFVVFMEGADSSKPAVKLAAKFLS